MFVATVYRRSENKKRFSKNLSNLLHGTTPQNNVYQLNKFCGIDPCAGNRS